MKNKTSKIIITSTVLLSSLVVGNTAFAQTPPAPTVGLGYAGGMHRAPGVHGSVMGVNGTLLTITSKGFGQSAVSSTYTVDATNATVTKNGAASTISAIAIGDMVGVEGPVSGANVIATTIRDGDFGKGGMGRGMRGGRGMMGAPSTMANMPAGNGQPIIGGNVTTFNGNTLTLTNKSNVTYTVDATTATVTKGGVASGVSSVAVGDQVIVQGTVNGNSVTATSVMDQGVHSTATQVTDTNGRAVTPPQHQGFFGMIGGFFGHLFGF